jgi:hypothetical protein
MPRGPRVSTGTPRQCGPPDCGDLESPALILRESLKNLCSVPPDPLSHATIIPFSTGAPGKSGPVARTLVLQAPAKVRGALPNLRRDVLDADSAREHSPAHQGAIGPGATPRNPIPSLWDPASLLLLSRQSPFRARACQRAIPAAITHVPVAGICGARRGRRACSPYLSCAIPSHRRAERDRAKENH